MSEPRLVTVYCVFADEAEARRIGRLVIEERLAGCVNILEACRSIYRWEGRIEEASEVPALFKTRAEVAERLMLRLQQLHSYDVPAIVVWPIADVPLAYARWVEDQTQG